MGLVKGKRKSIRIPPHRKQMGKVEAAKYYNGKLRNVWSELLKKEFPCDKEREQIINHVATKSVKYIRYCHSLRRKR